jgi:hypothetical protein
MFVGGDLQFEEIYLNLEFYDVFLIIFRGIKELLNL